MLRHVAMSPSTGPNLLLPLHVTWCARLRQTQHRYCTPWQQVDAQTHLNVTPAQTNQITVESPFTCSSTLIPLPSTNTTDTIPTHSR
mmetsp:Transcript_972/g.2016  ORF Transcript_972/g.2016 Transcript_972/m.2016 type:complete len:87 (+) Transcript_972:171-431(+)